MSSKSNLADKVRGEPAVQALRYLARRGELGAANLLHRHGVHHQQAGAAVVIAPDQGAQHHAVILALQFKTWTYHFA